MTKIEQAPSPALLAYAEAQRYLGGISRSTLKALVASGEVQSITIHRRRLFSRAALDSYISIRLAHAERLKT